jgi:hypothetical protein
MSDYVMIIIVIALLIAVVVTLLFGGKIRVWWKDKGLTAESREAKGTSMKMVAHGLGSKILRGRQVKQGSGDSQMTMEARDGGELVDVELREENLNSETEPEQ